ncbi:hypothetical protein LCGC14_2638830 [marine sediment metagenome]|uniref:Uncharacterized protein n=1 Tax=marine sediment metagenome TaxID=412755 RepID=A0A0F9C8W2_9ZZZZ
MAKTIRGKLVAVHAHDLGVLQSFACEHKREGEADCDEADIERGGCCNSCWASRFAKRALEGRVFMAPEADEPASIDAWDLIGGLVDTVIQLGGQAEIDYEGAQVTIHPPKPDGRTEIKLVFEPKEAESEAEYHPE